MAKQTGGRTQVQYIEEVTFGTTPATPTMKEILLPAGFAPATQSGGFQSGDLRSDRQTTDYRTGFKSTAAPMPVEFKHGEFDDFLEGALFGTWSTDVLKAGTDVHSYSVEVGYLDASRFHMYRGMMVNNFSIALAADAEIVTGNFDFIGADKVRAASTGATATTPAGAKRAFDQYSGSVTEGGAGSNIITGIELSLANNLEALRSIGTAFPTEVLAGRSVVTGTLRAFYEDDSLLDKFLNDTPTSLSFVLQDPDANTLTFDLPRVVYTGGAVPVAQEGALIVELPFQATYDAAEQTALKITRSA